MDGMARCDACPKQTENRLKIAGGALLGLGLLAFLVRINLGSEGKRTTAEMYQIIILDYLQTSSLVVTMDVPWPEMLQFIFSVQGVVSTIREHLLSPDCELTDVRPVGSFVRVMGLLAYRLPLSTPRVDERRAVVPRQVHCDGRVSALSAIPHDVQCLLCVAVVQRGERPILSSRRLARAVPVWTAFAVRLATVRATARFCVWSPDCGVRYSPHAPSSETLA
jgi:hypothetical protein